MPDDAAVADNPVVDEDLSSPSFSEAYEKASSTLQSSKTEEGETQPEVEAPKEPAQEEKKETPLDQFDPEKLPPELKPLYKNLMKGFTQGRQKDREEIVQLKKEIEAFKEVNNPKIPTKPLTLEEQVDKLVKEKVTEEKVDSFRNQALSDFDSMDVRLTRPTEDKPNEKYDKIMDSVIGAQLDELLQEHIEKNGSELGFDYKSKGKNLISDWDKYIQSRVDDFLGKQREIAKKGERSFEKMNPKASTSNTTPSGSMSLEQAVSAAIRKHHS